MNLTQGESSSCWTAAQRELGPPLNSSRKTPQQAAGNVSAFTLIELLAGAAIALALTGLTLAIVAHFLEIARRCRDDAAASASARLALDRIARDLQAAIFRATGDSWLAVDLALVPSEREMHGWVQPPFPLKPFAGESLRLVPLPGDTSAAFSAARFGGAGAWLRFLTTNAESSGSRPVAVSYQIARRSVNGGSSGRYRLYRSAVSPENTWTNGNNALAAGYASSSPAPGLARAGPTLTNPPGSDMLAADVVDFGVWLYARKSDGSLRRIFPADAADLSHRAITGSGGSDAQRFPEVADVFLRVLTSRGAELLAEMEQGRGSRPDNFVDDAAWWWGIAERNSRVFIRRVALQTEVE
jgi:hypothetical protein